MAISTLRFSPYSWRRTGQLSNEQQSKLADTVSKRIYQIISSRGSGKETLENHPDLSWTGSFVDAYLGDLAGHVLQCLADKPTRQCESYWSEESHSEKVVRTLTVRLFRLFVNTPAPNSNTGVLFNLSNLVDFVIAYGADYPKTTGSILSEALSMSPPGLVASYKNELVLSLKKSLNNVTSSSSSISACKTAYIVSHVLKCITLGNQTNTLIMAFAEEPEFVEAIAKAYSTCHLNHEKLNSSPDDLEGQRWYRVKIELINSLHAMVNFLAQDMDIFENRNILFGMLVTLLNYNHLFTESPSPSASMSPLNTESVLRDYEYVFALSQTLVDVFGTDHNDSRIYPIIVSLQELVPAQNKKRIAGPWLKPFLQNRKTVSKSQVSGPYPISKHENETSLVTSSKRDKGKGKAVDLGVPSEEHSMPDIDLAVSQILDIFPDQPVETVRRYLQHPSFQGDTEKVIAALLEGNIPPDLLTDEPPEQFDNHQPAPHSEFKYTKDRRNIWDDFAIDESQLRIGKTRNDADAILSDRSFMEQMKADILRRAQENSDDEEEADIGIYKGKGKAVAGPTFFDDSEVDVNVKVGGDGEATSDSDSEDEGDETEAVPTPETILELAYIDNPKLFDRDATTRRSKARADLRAKTGWVDEQIEGWRIMLERNPRKDKILQKFEFSGNKPIQAETSASKSASTSEATEQQPNAGHGHHGRGRGRGRGGGRGGGRGMHHQQGEASSTSSRDHTWKDKNKSRMANHNRKRGHDKKMARGFGAAG